MNERDTSTLTQQNATTHSFGLYLTICVMSRLSQHIDHMTLVNNLNFFVEGMKSGMIDGQKKSLGEDVFYDALESQSEDELSDVINITLKMLNPLENTVNNELSNLADIAHKHFERTLDKLQQAPKPKDISERILLYPQFNSQVLELVATNYLLELHDDELAKKYLDSKNATDSIFSTIIGIEHEFSFSSGHKLGEQMIAVALSTIDNNQIENFVNLSTQLLTTYTQIAPEVEKLMSSGIARVLPKDMMQVALGGITQGIIDSTIHNEPSSASKLLQSIDRDNWRNNFNLLYTCTTSLCSRVIQDYKKAYNTALAKQGEVATAINNDIGNYIGENSLATPEAMFDDYLLAQSVNASKNNEFVSPEAIGYTRFKACIKASTGVLNSLLYSTSHEAGKAGVEIMTVIKPHIIQSAVSELEVPTETKEKDL